MFLGIEILSIAVYVMAALHQRRLTSQEAGFKYFVLGALSSALLLYGIAFLYGATGSTSLVATQQFLSERVVLNDAMLLLGLTLIMVGFAFKVGAAPFHMWTPDVYQGSPSPAVAYMASAVKVAAFAGMLRVFVVAFSTYRDFWRPLVIAIALLSLFVGSITALVQNNVKRMLAYSSIAHAGFVLVGVEAASARGTAATLFYLAAYTVMAAGSFGVVTLVGRTGDAAHGLVDYRGLSRSNPGLALAFTVLLLAQAGTPFTVGFLAKFGVIGAAVDADQWILAVAAMVSAVISAYLYLRVIVAMYFEEDDADAPVEAVGVPRMAAVAIGLTVAVTLAAGVAPQPLERMAEDAVPQFVAGD
jgi:NADH-quinone oxidoreductase subunit N